jgi:hypothetical protein
MNKEYFKVLLRLRNNTLVSSGRIPRGFRLSYRVDKPTRSPIPGGRLFVFESKLHALTFEDTVIDRISAGDYSFYKSPKTEIWRVDVTNPDAITLLPELWYHDKNEKLSRDMQKVVARFWQNPYGVHLYTHGIGRGMAHTFVVDSIQLIEKV